jgi:predicted MFS family arabinose efflux permease
MRSVIVIALAVSSLFGAATFMPLFFQMELGSSPAEAGMRLTALMAGVIIASFSGGRIVSRTGRYKIFPVMGLAIATMGMLGMSWAVHSLPGLLGMEFPLFCVGLGVGFVMPNLTTAIQNAVPRDMMGVATSGTAFFRSLGAALGVASAGAALNMQLAHLVPVLAIPGAPAHESLEQIAALSPDLAAALRLAYRTGLARIFLASSGITFIAFLIALTIPEKTLRDKPAA